MNDKTHGIRQVALVGGGAFGTAVANIIASNGVRAELWVREPAQAMALNETRENKRYLPGHRLHDLVSADHRLKDVIGRADLVILTVPSRSFREVARELCTCLPEGMGLVSATKGVEVEGFVLMSQVLAEECPQARTGVLSGPNIAEEMARGQFAGTVVASRDAALRQDLQLLLSSASFRAYTSEDMYGVELAGALKNIYAIACGIATTLNAGQNAIGMLITRSLAEMGRLAIHLNANPYTLLGLAGVGDLMVTCTSPLSRNFRFGKALAEGRTTTEAMETLGKLVEGVYTLEAVEKKRVEANIYMPIVAGLHQIIQSGQDIATVIEALMSSGMRVDVEFATPPAMP